LLTKTELHVDKKTLEEKFFRVVEEEASIEGINRVIERADKLKAVLKARDRINKIAKHIAEHYKKFVEPLGFKAFIVAVDREHAHFTRRHLISIYRKNTHCIYT